MARKQLLLSVFISLAFTAVSQAKIISTQIVDSLGRPVEGVEMEIYWLKSFPDGGVEKKDGVFFKSDQAGRIQGKYNEKLVPSGEYIWIKLSKARFAGFSTTDIESEYIIKRKLQLKEFDSLLKLKGTEQTQKLRELLAADTYDWEKDLDELIFKHEVVLRPSLRKLIKDDKVWFEASLMLARIAVPEDIQTLIENDSVIKQENKNFSWKFAVLASLLTPSTDKEWDFLREHALNESGQDFQGLDIIAIQTLKLIATSKSLKILEQAKAVNFDRVSEVSEAIKYIETQKAPISDLALTAAGDKLAQSFSVETWYCNHAPIFNESSDKAYIKIEFLSGLHLNLYVATFHKDGAHWVLRGVRKDKSYHLTKDERLKIKNNTVSVPGPSRECVVVPNNQ